MKLATSPNPFIKMGAPTPFLTDEFTELQTKARALKAEESGLRETISPVQTVPSPAECNAPAAIPDSVPESHRRLQQLQQQQQQMMQWMMQQQQQQQQQLQQQQQQQQQQQFQQQQLLHQQQQQQQINLHNDDDEDNYGSDDADADVDAAEEQTEQQQQQQHQHKRKKVLGGLVARNSSSSSSSNNNKASTAVAAAVSPSKSNGGVSASGRSVRARQPPRRLMDTYSRADLSDSEDFDEDDLDSSRGHGQFASRSNSGNMQQQQQQHQQQQVQGNASFNNSSSSASLVGYDADDDFMARLAGNDMDDFRIEHISEREQKQLREQLKRRLKELETCTEEMKGLSSGERKKLRNRKASCVSRLKKKLILAELADHLDRQKDKIRNAVALCDFYRQESDQLFRRLQRYEPTFQRTPAPAPETLPGAARSQSPSPGPRPANVGHITKRTRVPVGGNPVATSSSSGSSSNSHFRAAERTSSGGSNSGRHERTNCFCNSSKAGQMVGVVFFL